MYRNISNTNMGYLTWSRRAEHLPHPRRARTVFSHHRQLEGQHSSASKAQPVTPITSKFQPSIFLFFQAIQADPKHPGKPMVTEPPFYLLSARPRLNPQLSVASSFNLDFTPDFAPAGISPTGTRDSEVKWVPPIHPMK